MVFKEDAHRRRTCAVLNILPAKPTRLAASRSCTCARRSLRRVFIVRLPFWKQLLPGITTLFFSAALYHTMEHPPNKVFRSAGLYALLVLYASLQRAVLGERPCMKWGVFAPNFVHLSCMCLVVYSLHINHPNSPHSF